MNLLILNMLMTISFYTCHPLILIISLILSTTIVAYYTFISTKIALFSYMILLVLLGGLIILFIYMASIAPNEPINTKKIKKIMFYMMLFSLLTTTIFYKYTQISTTPMKNMEILLLMNNTPLILIAATYLFITLIAVVQITKITMGPLRSNI